MPGSPLPPVTLMQQPTRKWSDVTASAGRVCYGSSLAGFGILNVIYADGVFGLEPVPSWAPTRAGWSWLTGACLVAAALGIASGKGVRRGAVVAAGVIGVWVLALQVPQLIASPNDGGAWTTAFETLALWGGAWALVAPGIGIPTGLGPTMYATSLPIFGVLHFVYRGYVASVIPAWIPNPAAWAVVTGVAFIAAGLSMLSGVLSRLAAAMVGLMFALWVAILHAPRALSSTPTSRSEWTSLCVALGMCGSAWVIAGTCNSRKGWRWSA